MASAVVALAVACGGAPSARPQGAVAIYVAGDRSARPALVRAVPGVKSLPFELQLRRLPGTAHLPPRATAAIEQRLAQARKAYIDAEFGQCVSQLDQADLVRSLLGEGERELAARVLLWRAACHLGATDRRAAQDAARALAVMSLRTPADVESATPEVEEILAESRRAVSAERVVPLRIDGKIEGARVMVDGIADLCATPCVVDVAPGDHVVAVDGDGLSALVRVVRAGPAAPAVILSPGPASPEQAAHQWTARYAAGTGFDTASSVALLAQATRSRRMIVLSGESQARGLRLRGVLALDGKVAARAERAAAGDVDDATGALLRDLLERGQLLDRSPPWYRRPSLWIAIGVSGLAAAGLTAYVLASDRTTAITF